MMQAALCVKCLLQVLYLFSLSCHLFFNYKYRYLVGIIHIFIVFNNTAYQTVLLTCKTTLLTTTIEQ